METPGRPDYSVAARISTQMVQLVARYTGRGPTRARTTLNTNFAAVLLEDVLTKAEVHFVAAGEHEAVRRQRRTLHNLMRDEAVGSVEQMTGRRVRAYLSDVDPEEALAMHFFVFETRPESGTTAVAEVAGDDASRASR
jgi:uncharacterized protein YbcI